MTPKPGPQNPATEINVYPARETWSAKLGRATLETRLKPGLRNLACETRPVIFVSKPGPTNFVPADRGSSADLAPFLTWPGPPRPGPRQPCQSLMSYSALLPFSTLAKKPSRSGPCKLLIRPWFGALFCLITFQHSSQLDTRIRSSQAFNQARV